VDSQSRNPRREALSIVTNPGFAILFLLFFTAPAFAQIDRRVAAIDKLRAKIDQDIAKSEAEPEYSNIYLTELAVNKNNGSYPAVGIYRPVVKFYYTYGDREKEPYPNRLLKIVVDVDRSDRKEHSEFVFDEAQRLVFYLGKKAEVEQRVYFTAGRAIRFEQGGQVVSLRTRAQTVRTATILKEKTSLVSIFRKSLGF
jgi:hypothetical protein